jgi:hypothetical protein
VVFVSVLTNAGEFLDGALSGAGSCKYSNGDVYIGQFENDAFHGEGK